ncbi:RNA polymerase sigma factor [Fibrella aquatilis]|uniref:RNA polymerase sigma factor n=1 Tax=Fibrella aquatilis TaxID=2817059 RepID=A0A939K0R4_9BACT|nr:RNA polymerase sigma factor [Fibrella aquatilis]MBO0931495.1 RNA polymerase sigma factor [Fibrella aquatilis]
MHPFHQAVPTNPPDETLVADAVGGNRRSLEVLLKRHQDYVFNVALRLFLHPDDALDATQEVLIKVVTSLKTFAGQSGFRTWLYRIVVNHFLNSPLRRYEQQHDRVADLSQLPDVPEREANEAEIEEVRVLCATAMLLCLTREQRLLYIIGDIFGADHELGAALFDLTPGNYRVRLHRANADLRQFVGGKCGLVDPRNPCRCPKKARAMVQQGVVDKDRLLFNRHYTQTIEQVVHTRREAVSDTIQLAMGDLFRQSPFQVRQEIDQLFETLLP